MLGKQAITSWNGFHRRPSFKEVADCIEKLEKAQSKSSGVNNFRFMLSASIN